MSSKKKEIVLVLSDHQAPFQHPDCLPFYKAIKKEFKPTKVVCIGDLVDQHALSLYTRSPDGLSASNELTAAIKHLKELYVVFPEVYFLVGNHDVRVYKRASEAGIPIGYLKDYLEWLEAPKGWTLHNKIFIDGVMYFHGEGYSGSLGARSAAVKNGQSCVIGHIHSHAGALYIANHNQLYFGMNVGSMIDNEAYCFEYNKTNSDKPIISCGIVHRGFPLVIPMPLNKKGRWDGTIPFSRN